MNKFWSYKRMFWKTFIALLGIVVSILCISMSVGGFHGTLSPALSGLGWLLYAWLVLCMAVTDTIEAIFLIKMWRKIKVEEQNVP